MRRLRALGHFLWDFVVGDDWRIAVGVGVALGCTSAVAGAGIAAWWILPLSVLGLLGLSMARAPR